MADISKIIVRFSLSKNITITNLKQISSSLENQNLKFKKMIDELQEFQKTLVENFPLLISKFEELAKRHGVEELKDINRIPIEEIINKLVTESLFESRIKNLLMNLKSQ